MLQVFQTEVVAQVVLVSTLVIVVGTSVVQVSVSVLQVDVVTAHGVDLTVVWALYPVIVDGTHLVLV